MLRHNLEQGSPEWLSFRNTHIGASEAPILMGESPYKRTPLMLWKEKTGLSAPQVSTPAMQRGQVLEEQARQLFQNQFNISVPPVVGTHEEREYMLASFDGLSSDGKVAIEIKCVKREFHDMALNHKIPQGFYGQMQHQIYVGDVKEMYYVSYFPNEADEAQQFKVLPVKRDDVYIAKMLKEEQKFWDCLVNLIPPDSVELDYESRFDEDWCMHAQNAVVYAEKAREFKTLYEQEKAKLIELSRGANTKGGGIKLTRYSVKGRVEYDKIPELQEVNLDQYRAKTKEQYKVTPIKND